MNPISNTRPRVQPFLDPESETFSYVVFDPQQHQCAIIDPVLDFDYNSGRTSTQGADQMIGFIQQQQLQVQWILETHAHADHLSAAPYIKEQLGGTLAIGEHIQQVQRIFSAIFNFEAEFMADGHPFDRLFADGDQFTIGTITAQVIHTPGHTPADLAYHIGNALFVGDTLFMPDIGTARCDFPGGDAATDVAFSTGECSGRPSATSRTQRAGVLKNTHQRDVGKALKDH